MSGEFEIRCTECGKTGWVSGYVEHDTNAFIVDENDIRVNEICEHISDGGEFEGTGKLESGDDYDQ